MGVLRRFFFGTEASPGAIAEPEEVARLCGSSSVQDRVRGVALARHTTTLDILARDPAPEVRRAVAEKGHGHLLLATDECPSVAYTVVTQTESIDALEAACRNISPCVRVVAVRRLGTNAPRRMAKDRDGWVRATYATITPHRAVLRALLRDPDPLVRAALARRGYGLDVLSGDSVAAVRAAAALSGDYSVCARLKDDPVDTVRIAVAEAGRWHSQLLHDPSHSVRAAVERKMRNGTTTPSKGCQFDSAPFRAIRSS